MVLLTCQMVDVHHALAVAVVLAVIAQHSKPASWRQHLSPSLGPVSFGTVRCMVCSLHPRLVVPPFSRGTSPPCAGLRHRLHSKNMVEWRNMVGP